MYVRKISILLLIKEITQFIFFFSKIFFEIKEFSLKFSLRKKFS